MAADPTHGPGGEDFYWKQEEISAVMNPEAVDGPNYRIPGELTLSPTTQRHLLFVGSCLLAGWPRLLEGNKSLADVDFINFNNASEIPKLTKDHIDRYDYQICQIPMRSLLFEQDYMSLNHSDEESYYQLLDLVKGRTKLNFEMITAYNTDYNLNTFVLNFVTPQQNPMGRLQERYSPRNLVYFVEQMNVYLNSLVSSRSNCYMIDLEQIVCTFGKKYYLDDLISHFNHSGAIGGLLAPEETSRFEASGDPQVTYSPRTKKIAHAVIAETEASCRTIEQQDSLKLVIFDLDDTLWRGIAAEREHIDPSAMMEGWPLGIVEAASYLWRRGILIAIVSKNDEHTARMVWDDIYGSRFSLDHFAAIKINWKPKADNVREIIHTLNLLPASVLFVDDNPVERASVKAAFPEIRVLDAALVHWRRILLWAPELQRSVITGESSQRTETVKAQIEREELSHSLSRDDFLGSLNVRLRWFKIERTDDPHFDRAFELLNKTNQFNTTGRRWTQTQIEQLFAGGGAFLAFDVKDKYASYGLIALMVIARGTIEQFVMSCRVFGMDIERACVALARDFMSSSGFETVKARVQETGKNILSLSFIKGEGFEDAGDGVWTFRKEGPTEVPGHITVFS